MGLSFKENCPDLRNTKVIDILEEFKDYGLGVEVYDPWVDPEEALLEYGIEIIPFPSEHRYDGVVLAVGHQDFVDMPITQIRSFMKEQAVLFDVKNILPTQEIDGSL